VFLLLRTQFQVILSLLKLFCTLIAGLLYVLEICGRLKLKIHCGVYDASMATVLYRFISPEGLTGKNVLSLRVSACCGAPSPVVRAGLSCLSQKRATYRRMCVIKSYVPILAG
jgi:hypothetical protein